MRRAALIALLVLAPPSAPLARAADTHAHVACTDYVSGSYRRVSLDTRAPLACDVAIGGDPAIRWHGGLAWVINRFGGDNLQAIDPVACATVEQHSAGNGTNPQDAVFTSAQRVYVSRYETSDLVALDPATGATLATIPLAAFADADGLPEMAQMARVGPLLFVALQRLDRNAGFTPADSSLVVVVDTRADTVLDVRPQAPGVQAIRLALTNPITAFQFDRATSRLLIGCAGAFGVADGGVEWIDPVALASAGVAVTEAALGGDVSDLVWRDAQRSFAIVSDASFNTVLVSFRAADGTHTGTVWSPGGYVLADAALNDRDELWIANNGFTAPGLYVRDATTGAALAGPIDVGLPPREIVFDRDAAITGADPRVATLDWLGPTPNPARAAARFVLALAEPSEVALDVIDVAGRRVRSLARGPLPAGRHDMAWNLADDAGRRVAAGVYFARLAVGPHVAARRFVVTR